MSPVFDLIGTVLVGAGVVFLLASAVALWRLPDMLSRLHALTKADTAGLALVALGAAFVAGSPAALLPLVLCVVLTAVSGVTVGHLVARAHLQDRSR